MNKKLIIASLALLAVVATSGALLIGNTQKATAEVVTAEESESTPAHHLGFKGKGENMLDHKAEMFGMTVEELQASLEEGKTFIEIAEEQGLTLTDIQEQMKAKKDEWLQARIDSGFLTQEQADQIKQNMEERMADGGMLPGFGPGKDVGHGMRHGGMQF